MRDKKVVALDMRSTAYLEASLIKQGMLFFARLLMFLVCAVACACNHMPHMLKPSI